MFEPKFDDWAFIYRLPKQTALQSHKEAFSSESEDSNLNKPHESQSMSKLADDDHLRELIESAKTNREAVAQLYHMHYSIVATYVHHRVPVADEADDIVSEVFITMVKELPRFRWRGVPFSAWLYRIAICKISRWARRRRRLESIELDSIRDCPNGPSEHIDAELVAMALASLPFRLQDVLSLHYFEGLSVEEIATVVNRSLGTVKSRLHYGRAKMREELERRGMKIE